ncbi:MAG: DUF2179 domain-containing protein [Bacteroidales bacterium]|nr:DUF2179 domain-containing protein [Bacteroidales bacterium]
MFELLVIPLLIFFARIADVTLGTLRIIFVSKGLKFIAPVVGFIEIMIWITAITKIMENLNNWYCYIAYAGGFAAGNFVGMILEEKLAIGCELVRVITKKEASELIINLKEKGYGITSVKAQGIEGEVSVLYVIVNRKNLSEVVNIIKSFNPQALYTIENIRFVNRNIYHKYHNHRRIRLFKN